MTPLFPSQGPITIRQGIGGSCYLLSSLDCILNLGEEGEQLIKSLFTQTEDGKVIVRIKRHEALKDNLQKNKMTGKYTHYVDELNNEDVFEISLERLKEIDNQYGGVKSNSLAIKILERLVSYYYAGNWSNTNPLASVVAHDIPDRIAGFTSTAFVGKFFGIQAEDIPYSRLDDIIKLKLMNPDEPVYISMSYGKVDGFGKFHGRHALRIDKIIPKGSGNYDFVLINPHDNSKTETYRLDDLNKRNCRFCLFNTNIHRASLTKKLLTLSNEEGSYVFANSGLQKRLISLEEMNLLTNNKIISSCISLHKQIPYLEKLFLKLSVDEKKILTTCIANADGSKKEFLKLLITRIPALDLLELVLNEETSQELLGEVLKELALSNQVEENKLSPKASINFNSEAFLNLIVKSAIKQKINQLGYTPEKAKQEIESGIINFYFGGASSSLTRASGLRALFIANVFSKKSIETLFAPKARFAKAIANYLALKTLPDLLIEYIKSKDASPIDEEFFGIVFASATFNNPDELFENLYRLSQINPEVAKALFAFASQKLNVLFGISLDEYAKKIALKESVEFKSWFESLSNPQPAIKIPVIDNILRQQRVEDAKRVISDIVQRINLFTFSFDGYKSVEHVTLNAEEFRGQLKQIINSGELQNALQVLDIHDEHPDVQKALQRKLRMIDTAANRRIDFLKKYEADIDEQVRQIREFPINFNDANTIVAIESRRILLNKKLHKLVKAEDLLGEQLIANPKIKIVYYAQVEKINSQAELLQKQLLDEGQKIIDSVEKRINNFAVRFNDRSTSSAIERQRNHLLQQLDNLAKPNQALLSAEKVLDCTDLQPSIVRALQAKKQEINETADQLIIKINAEEVVKSYEKQIREFPINFNRCQTVEEVIARKQDLIQSARNLVGNKPDLLKAQEQLQLLSGEHHSDITMALTDKVREINRQADAVSKRITDQIAATKEILNILAEIKFSDHLKTIESMVKTLETKAVGDENYKRAAPIARTFYNNLLRAEERFKNSQLPKNVKCNDFHQACVRAINAVIPVLEVHRGWKQVFADLASALVTLCTLGGANLYAGRWRLFPVSTESEKIVKDFSLSMQPLAVRA
ncbi:TPA: Dot/Icm secretion system substrate [Legionella pneumophila]|nr:Dot/Icm secretion system substrate [Legionella pneumophila]HBI2945787.1 Dot/Icm secretion system substrate [Legionella pneumophila]